VNTFSTPRRLILILGDQLNRDSAVFDDFDPDQDLIWMAETHQEATHVWSHKQRLVLFFSAMRHFAQSLESEGISVRYHHLSSDPVQDRGSCFSDLLSRDLKDLRPESLVMCPAGDDRVRRDIGNAIAESGIPIRYVTDRHFLITEEEFQHWCRGKKQLRMETFYRYMRKRYAILMEENGSPEGGDWNFDSQNRKSFGKEGPGPLASPSSADPDEITQSVIRMVNSRFPDHPGRLHSFEWPVTAEQAEQALTEFIGTRLANFGTFEDAIWTGEHLLYHSRLSAALNLKLISPMSCIHAAETAYQNGKAPLNSVEGFIRQLLGWREFIRGIYWTYMPEYERLNELQCEDRGVPAFFWDGDTDMACARDAMESVMDRGWSHHIQRLMVLGEFSLLIGVHPYKFHEWHMAMYVDAIDWVSLPNTLGMSQYGDGGIVGSKPYCASGNYIHKMSNACSQCRYSPQKATGPDACPFTTLYWDFLDRHHSRFSSNMRMKFQIRNLERKKPEEMENIRKQADAIRQRYAPRSVPSS